MSKMCLGRFKKKNYFIGYFERATDNTTASIFELRRREHKRRMQIMNLKEEVYLLKRKKMEMEIKRENKTPQ